MLLSAVRDIFEAFYEYTDRALKYALVAVAVYLTIMMISFVVRGIQGRRVHSIWYVFGKTCLFALLGVYSSYLVSLTLFNREEGSRAGLVNLSPFSTIGRSRELMLAQLENIVLFVPFGFLVPFVWKYFRKIFAVFVLTFVASLSIEVAQIYTSRGFFDVDDIILNTIGGVAGYILFSAVYDGFLAIKRRIIIDVSRKANIAAPLGKLYDRFVLRNGIVLFGFQGFLAFVWFNMVMGFSSDNGDQSGSMSKGILKELLRILGVDLFHGMNDTQLGENDTFLLLEKIIRKMAHMFEYGVLAILVWALFYSIRWVAGIMAYGAGLVAALLTGIIDEMNQATVAGRTGIYTDVIVDTFGAIVALTLVAIIVGSMRRHLCKKLG